MKQEIDNVEIKTQLQLWGIAILLALVLLPFGLPGWLFVPSIVLGTTFVGYVILKRREGRQKASLQK